MIIVIDTREKKDAIKHITAYFDVIEQPYIRSKLYVGDYTDAHAQAVVIDRKQSLLELAGNLGKGHERFKREILRAKAIGARFVVLIEEAVSLDRVGDWIHHRSKMNGTTLQRIMRTLSAKYGVEWLFCHKAKTPETILSLAAFRTQVLPVYDYRRGNPRTLYFSLRGTRRELYKRFCRPRNRAFWL